MIKKLGGKSDKKKIRFLKQTSGTAAPQDKRAIGLRRWRVVGTAEPTLAHDVPRLPNLLKCATQSLFPSRSRPPGFIHSPIKTEAIVSLERTSQVFTGHVPRIK